MCETDYVFEAYIPFTALDASDVRSVQIGFFREHFLGIAEFVSQIAYGRAENQLWVV
jgi:hypothetical protein